MTEAQGDISIRGGIEIQAFGLEVDALRPANRALHNGLQLRDV